MAGGEDALPLIFESLKAIFQAMYTTEIFSGISILEFFIAVAFLDVIINFIRWLRTRGDVEL